MGLAGGLRGARRWQLSAGRADALQVRGTRGACGRSDRCARGRRTLGRHGSSSRGSQATSGRRAGRHGVGAQGRAAGRTVRARHGRPGRGLGAGWVHRLGQLGQFWCTVHLAQFWLGFWTRFDLVFS